MFLSRVSLRDVRCIEAMSLDLTSDGQQNRRWTLLLGENGCGKSSFLRATALLLAGSEALPDLIGEPDAWIRNGADQCSIEATLMTADCQQRDIALVIKRGDLLKNIYHNNRATLKAIDDAIAHADRNYFVLGYGVSRRPAIRKSRSSVFEEKSRSARARAMATMFSHDASLVSLEEWAMDLDYRKGKRSLVSVRTALDKLLPDMAFKRIDRNARQLVFDTVDGEVPLSQLSDGYQNMAAWCGDLLYRITETFGDRKAPLSTRGLLLIDELDLHLHPVWRRKLVEFLSSTLPHFQFLVTTHSALAAQQCGENELYVIRREGPEQRPTLVGFKGEPRKMMLHQLLMSPMFGVASMDSVEVEEARVAVRKLKGKRAKLTASESKQVAEAKKILRTAPDWDAVPKYAQKQSTLLKEIKQSMAKRGALPKLSPRKLKASVKSLGRKK